MVCRALQVSFGRSTATSFEREEGSRLSNQAPQGRLDELSDVLLRCSDSELPITTLLLLYQVTFAQLCKGLHGTVKPANCLPKGLGYGSSPTLRTGQWV